MKTVIVLAPDGSTAREIGDVERVERYFVRNVIGHLTQEREKKLTLVGKVGNWIADIYPGTATILVFPQEDDN